MFTTVNSRKIFYSNGNGKQNQPILVDNDDAFGIGCFAMGGEFCDIYGPGSRGMKGPDSASQPAPSATSASQSQGQ